MSRKNYTAADTTPDMFTPAEMGIFPTYSQPALIEPPPEPKKAEPPPERPSETPKPQPPPPETSQTPRGTEPAPLVITHANPRGTGARATLRVIPARGTEPGYIDIAMAEQLTIGDRRGPTPTPSTFDDAHPIAARLEFLDICKLLQVFRGETESVNDEKGLYFRRNDEHEAQRVLLRHVVDPIPGYPFDVYEAAANDRDEDRHAGIVFSPAEALGIALAIEHTLSLICFGMPAV